MKKKYIFIIACIIFIALLILNKIQEGATFTPSQNVQQFPDFWYHPPNVPQIDFRFLKDLTSMFIKLNESTEPLEVIFKEIYSKLELVNKINTCYSSTSKDVFSSSMLEIINNDMKVILEQNAPNVYTKIVNQPFISSLADKYFPTSGILHNEIKNTLISHCSEYQTNGNSDTINFLNNLTAQEINELNECYKQIINECGAYIENNQAIKEKFYKYDEKCAEQIYRGPELQYEPTTEAPTSTGTTYMPTTGMPTTYMPTTGMPTTGMPTTGMPTTGMPTTSGVTNSNDIMKSSGSLSRNRVIIKNTSGEMITNTTPPTNIRRIWFRFKIPFFDEIIIYRPF